MKPKFFSRVLKKVATLIFPKSKVVSKTPITDEPAVYLCNHSGAIGPSMMTLYFPKPHKTWIIGYVLDKEKAPNFIFNDFFFGRSKRCKWFWRILSKIVAKILRPLLEYGNPIPVYHDRRMIETFRLSLDTLLEGKDLVVFPECPTRYSEFINSFYTGFADMGRTYYAATGKDLAFYPVYVEKKNRVISVGEPVFYDHTKPPHAQRDFITEKIRDAIDGLARELSEHKPVPFLPKVWYDYYGEYENDPASYWRTFDK